MDKRKNIVFPRLEKILEEMGENIKLARLRRKLSAEMVAQRARISRTTLASIEKGASSVNIGSYINVLNVLGLAEDILLVGKDDLLGKKLQDMGLINKKRAPKKHIKDE